MDNKGLEDLLRTVDPAKRLFLKKVVLGAAFALPIIASYSVKDLAHAGEPCTSTLITFTSTTTTTTSTVTAILVTTTTVTTTVP